MQLEVKISDLQKHSLFVSAPMYGGNCTGVFAQSMFDLTSICKEIKINMHTHFLFNESLITRARNYCCDEFLRSPATHLMFIDSDIGFSGNDVIALLGLAISDPDKYDVVCGPYPKKTISWEKIKMAVDKGFADKNPDELSKFVGDYVFNPAGGKTSFLIGEPTEVLESGTGFMLISRRILEKYKEAFPEQSYRPDHVRTANFDGSREIHAFFDCTIDRGYNFKELYNLAKDFSETKLIESDKVSALQEKAKSLFELEKTASKRYLSEDYKFCQDVRSIGGKVWLCPWMQTRHVGSYVFGGSLADLARIGAPATADPNMIKGEQQDLSKKALEKKIKSKKSK